MAGPGQRGRVLVQLRIRDRAIEGGNVNIAPLATPSPATLPLEIVERKGVGHPDSICDALAENLSLALSRFYLDRFGAILHHNVDKALLCGGAAHPRFGGGVLAAPIEIYLAGRATTHFRGVEVPTEALAIEESRRWLGEHLSLLDPVHDVRIYPKLRPTSPDLAALFVRQQETGVALANDTSFGVGFAPLDELESMVLGVEEYLHEAEIKRLHPEMGDDIKIMGVRNGLETTLTVACALIDRHVSDLADYLHKKARVGELAAERARAFSSRPVMVAVNTADGATADSLYLTVTGLSAESGDDGQVGRGNRINGLITPYRPMSLEAVAGKNPVSHVGKLYNVLASRIAQEVVARVPDVTQAYCYLVSQIGRPVGEPLQIDVKVQLADSTGLPERRPRIEEIVHAHLAGSSNLWRELTLPQSRRPDRSM
jgi:S-adenosylmethionine synthetase